MPARRYISKFLFFALILGSSSCVKDVDLDQFEEITMPPTAAMDLVYFTLLPTDVVSPAGQPKKATDNVRLEFMDDDYIQNGLTRADFNFRFTNSFPHAFTATFKFLSESNAVTYTVIIEVPAGGAGQAAVIDYTQIVEGSNISKIKRSINMIVEIEMHPNPNPVEGELKLESKAYYYFDF